MDRTGRSNSWLQGPVPRKKAYQRKHIRITEAARKKVASLNKGTTPTRPTKDFLRGVGSEVITFEHLNVNGVNAHGGLIELDHIMRVFQNMAIALTTSPW